MRRSVNNRSLYSGGRNYRPPQGSSLLIGGIIRFIRQRVWAVIYSLLVTVTLSILAIIATAVYNRIKRALGQRSG